MALSINQSMNEVDKFKKMLTKTEKQQQIRSILIGNSLEEEEEGEEEEQGSTLPLIPNIQYKAHIFSLTQMPVVSFRVVSFDLWVLVVDCGDVGVNICCCRMNQYNVKKTHTRAHDTIEHSVWSCCYTGEEGEK